MPRPLVTCEVCENCICFCAMTAKDVLQASGGEASGLLGSIERIKDHEEYLRFLRQELEERARRAKL